MRPDLAVRGARPQVTADPNKETEALKAATNDVEATAVVAVHGLLSASQRRHSIGPLRFHTV
jgi:hypothetical protein